LEFLERGCSLTSKEIHSFQGIDNRQEGGPVGGDSGVQEKGKKREKVGCYVERLGNCLGMGVGIEFLYLVNVARIGIGAGVGLRGLVDFH